MSGTDWDSSKDIAKAILRDRTLRRRWVLRLVMVTVGWIFVGLWLIDGWLAGNPWRFIIWWGICGVMAVMLMIFSLYDSVAVVREERENSGKRRHE